MLLRTTPGQAMKNYTYVYILQSKLDSARHYTGMTEDLSARLEKHNKGGVPHTSKYKPWVIRSATAFDSHERAASFEKYLKTHSDRVFASRNF